MNRSYKKPEITTVNIATFKAELSKFLRLVQKGENVVVLDHKRPVARVVPFESDKSVFLAVTHATQSFADFHKIRGPSPERPAVTDSLQILLKDRAGR